MSDQRADAASTLETLQILSPKEMRQHCLDLYRRELAERVKTQDDVQGYALICAMKSLGVRARDQRAREAAEWLAKASRTPTDYAYWGKSAYWTIDEACALLSGIPPTRDFRSEDVLQLADYAAPAKRFADLQMLLLREHNDLPYVKLRPGDVLAWARRIGIEVPQPLGDAVDSTASSSPGRTDIRADAQLDPRTRKTLLCIIGALAENAKLDLSHPMKAGDAIAAMMPDVKLTGRAIGEHLKDVADAMDSRKG